MVCVARLPHLGHLSFFAIIAPGNYRLKESPLRQARDLFVYLYVVLGSKWAYLARKSGLSGCRVLVTQTTRVESVLSVSGLHFELLFHRVQWA